MLHKTPASPQAALGFAGVQQAAGNLAVQNLFRAGMIQAKLSVSQPGDSDEQEADRVAERVVSSASAGIIQRKCAPCAEGTTCPKCEEEEKVQTKEKPGHTPHIDSKAASQITSLRGGGQPLPPSARAFFEPRFGQDFSQVRVHTDGRAAESARAIQARAFTAGQDVVFGAGEYGPETCRGRKLLAHWQEEKEQENPEPQELLQRQTEEEEEKKETGAAQPETTAAETPAVAAHTEARIQAMRGGGQPLPAPTRAFFEPRLGYDLSQVRIHTSAGAAATARELNAQAFTHKENVFFGAGKYAPESGEGARLLAHELTHVAQQGAAHAVGNQASVAPLQRTDACEGTTRIQRYVGGDIRTMSITPEFAQALTDEELDQQMAIVRRQLAELSSGAPEYETTRANLDILSREQANRPWAIPGGGALQLPGAGGAATAPFAGPVVRIPAEVNYILLSSPEEAGPAAAVAAPGTAGFSWEPGLTSTALGGARGLGYVISPPVRGPIDPFLPLFSRLGSGQGPLGPLETGGYGLERYVSQNVLRDMRPRYATEVADLFTRERIGQSPWISAAGITERELSHIPGLVRQMAEGGLEALAPADRVLLTNFFRAHADAGVTFASPAMSATMQPGLSSMEGVAPFLREKPYVVRVELPSGAVGEVNAVLGPGRRAALASELEVLITTDARGNITSIRPNPTSALGRAAPALRWGGRALIVVGVAVSAERISTATEEQRPRVIGEEGGAWVGGYAVGSLAAAGCVALGIASGGIVLFLCGLGGAVIGGLGGSALGGEIGEAVGPRPLERVGSWAVDAYTESMLKSDNPTVRRDAVAIRRAVFNDDAMSWMYLLSRMAGY